MKVECVKPCRASPQIAAKYDDPKEAQDKVEEMSMG